MPNTVKTPKGREIELFGSFCAIVSAYGIRGAATFIIYRSGRVEASAHSPPAIRYACRPSVSASEITPTLLANCDAYLDRWGDQRWTGNESEEMAIGPRVDKDSA